MNASQLLENLLKLQSLELDAAKLDEHDGNKLERKIAELRLQIPLPILNHYDRLNVRGKKGVAAVRNQTCTGCHVRVTRALVMNLMRGEDLQVCENCGRYLYLQQSGQTEAPAFELPKKLPPQMKPLTELPDAA